MFQSISSRLAVGSKSTTDRQNEFVMQLKNKKKTMPEVFTRRNLARAINILLC